MPKLILSRHVHDSEFSCDVCDISVARIETIVCVNVGSSKLPYLQDNAECMALLNIHVVSNSARYRLARTMHEWSENIGV